MTTAIKTNGIGQRTTSHLNLTRTLADVWAEPQGPQEPWKPNSLCAWRPKTPYAGKDSAHA